MTNLITMITKVYMRRTKINYMSTYFDLDLSEQQHDFVKVFKVSSSDINNVPLLKNIFKRKTYNHFNWGINNK